MSYYLAPSLDNLRDEINARWPNRSKRSDGWIGDPAHAARVSDHNPNSRGSVNALDVTNDGIDVDALIAAAMRHPSTAYIISRGYIYSRRYQWAKRPYLGVNPHNTHVHISIQQTRTAEWDETRWFRRRSTFPLGQGQSFGTPRSAMVFDGTESPERARDIQRIQQRLRITPTGKYGPYTLVKVANWQLWKGLRPTGRVGASTWRRLGL